MTEILRYTKTSLYLSNMKPFILSIRSAVGRKMNKKTKSVNPLAP